MTERDVARRYNVALVKDLQAVSALAFVDDMTVLGGLSSWSACNYGGHVISSRRPDA